MEPGLNTLIFLGDSNVHPRLRTTLCLHYPHLSQVLNPSILSLASHDHLLLPTEQLLYAAASRSPELLLLVLFFGMW